MDKLVLRQSDLMTFKECGRKAWLSVYRQLTKPIERPNTSHIGTAIHAGVAAHYLHQNPMSAIESQMAIWESEGRCELEDMGEWLKVEEQAMITVEGYIEWVQETGVDQGLSFFLVEERKEKLLGTFSGVEVWISGQIDIGAVDDLGVKYLIDNKSRADLSEDPLLEISDQLQTYDWITDYEYDFGLHNILKRSKRTARATPPFYARAQIKFTDTKREAFMLQMNGVVQRMVDAFLVVEQNPSLHFGVLPPTPSKDCSWKCPFIEACPMFNLGDDVEGFLQDNFKTKNGYES